MIDLHIDYLDETNSVQQEELDMIEKLFHSIVKMENLSGEMEVSVTFVDNEKIRELNRQYRNIDKPTDVLSFPLEDETFESDEPMPRFFGDIVISIPKAKQQALDYNHSFQRELAFLAVHGFLHLLGYDHQTEEEEKIMFQKQKEILEKHGITR